ncbi:MAG: zinc ribbon domain-containing protein [Huintestinicola sp.]|uniref:zinc ribbon domain-containing protein n=1 Tax=Huintestinicola sp. TaxID=2981661 RepID=UPI003F0CC5E2
MIIYGAGCLKEETITKTIWQYSEKLDGETMDLLRGIACDYNKVKNYAYDRYSGIKSIDKLVPGYEILNEMRAGGMRQQLGLPAVYFEMALFEAIWDIKAMWQNLKNKIMSLANRNEQLTADDKSYIRIVLKINSVYSAILNDRPYEMPEKAKGLCIDVKPLNNRIKRWTRKYKATPRSDSADTFRVTPGGYSYRNGGIRLVSRVERKRVFIPLKDPTPYKRQLNIVIMDDYIKIAVPTEKKVIGCPDNKNVIYVHIGYKDMVTLSNGNVYGAELQKLVLPETERLAVKNNERGKVYKAYLKSLDSGDAEKAGRIENNNLGKIKYNSQKEKKYAETVKFINTELNKMFEKEKPCRVVITAPVRFGRMTKLSRSAKMMLSRSFAGYIRRRIEQKCCEKGIELIKINSKDTGNICSCCGAVGIRKQLDFRCEKCGAHMPSALNSAKNIEKKYLNNT